MANVETHGTFILATLDDVSPWFVESALSTRTLADAERERLENLGSALYIARAAFNEYRGDDPKTDERLTTALSHARDAFLKQCEDTFVRPRQ